jgi:sulfur-oxidizing protein SoxY
MLARLNTGNLEMRSISRRDAFALGAGTAIALLGTNIAFATPPEAAAEIEKFAGGKVAEQGRIKIELPEIAENGNTVPLSIAVDSPMNADDYVSEILVVADGNPRPGMARFRLTPASGRAEVVTRIRLNATENVLVVAKTSTGKLYAGQKLVKVTIGGCGG